MFQILLSNKFYFQMRCNNCVKHQGIFLHLNQKDILDNQPNSTKKMLMFLK